MIKKLLKVLLNDLIAVVVSFVVAFVYVSASYPVVLLFKSLINFSEYQWEIVGALIPGVPILMLYLKFVWDRAKGE